MANMEQLSQWINDPVHIFPISIGIFCSNQQMRYKKYLVCWFYSAETNMLNFGANSGSWRITFIKKSMLKYYFTIQIIVNSHSTLISRHLNIFVFSEYISFFAWLIMHIVMVMLYIIYKLSTRLLDAKTISRKVEKW